MTALEYVTSLIDRNEHAVRTITSSLELEHKATIWFCKELDKDPLMDETKLTYLMMQAFESVFENE